MTVEKLTIRPKKITAMKKTMKIGLLLACCLAVVARAFAQNNATCASSKVWIYTGHDRQNNTGLPVGPNLSSPDVNWIIVADTDPNTNEPRPAYAIEKASSSWKDPMPKTQWITSYPEAANAITGDYSFVYTFCMSSVGASSFLYLDIRSDNKSDVYLNGNWIGNTPTNASFGNAVPVAISTNNLSFFVAGTNELKIVDHNSESVKGINVSGYVEGNLLAQVPHCCGNPNSFITGLKWNDLNGDGIMQSSEPVMSGWQIQLSNGQTAVTDNHGYYFFPSLEPGSYTVTEIQQPGWTLTHPGTGNYQITLNSQEVNDGNNFGNKLLLGDSIPCKECIGSFAPIPGEKYVLSAWVKEANSLGKTTYTGPQVILTMEPFPSLPPMTAKGLIIDGWQRIESEFSVPLGTTAIRIKLANAGTNEVYFDDIRVSPFNASMKSFAYDPNTLRLMAELDERNYATFYEYDEQGALIRVKKETERGVKTIKESGNNTQIKQ